MKVLVLIGSRWRSGEKLSFGCINAGMRCKGSSITSSDRPWLFAILQAWAAQLPESAMAAVAIASLTGDLTALAALAEVLEQLYVTCGYHWLFAGWTGLPFGCAACGLSCSSCSGSNAQR